MSIVKNCDDQCCQYEIKQYKKIDFIPKSKKKAGVFIFDKKQNKVLLVQSRGNLWGCPKGTVEPHESIHTCALREVLEETGINLDHSEISVNHQFIYGDSYYFYLEKDEIPVTLDTPMMGNDATGIGWFKVNCLKKLVETKVITINFHCKLLLEFYLKTKFC